MPNSSGSMILLRLLQSLGASGGSSRDAASYLAAPDFADLLLRPLSGKMSSASAPPGSSSVGEATAATLPSLPGSVISTLLSAQPRHATPVLSYLSSGVLGGLLGSLIAPDAPDIQSPRKPFVLPSSIALEAGISSSTSPGALDYSHDGTPRTTSTSGQSTPSTVVVNVQAMDSRSFLDHSDDIARAVREALLNSHPLGDYFTE